MSDENDWLREQVHRLEPQVPPRQGTSTEILLKAQRHLWRRRVAATAVVIALAVAIWISGVLRDAVPATHRLSRRPPTVRRLR
ncbi:hypothetical protein [Jiangella rhizosphaerae]|uniref:DUF3040 domain-containing protein n=1 Tax=Jiangella rhizosphaerae TaxID=2293569 RepID=A0A418KHL3_9ACTN|nr:hypothetical protein [Jiangella rhizosphaerae]RIQ11890.1 hypothetical protein DY240_27980 [Jiangella rhizosphaerae]